jgi:hypothetical protein
MSNNSAKENKKVMRKNERCLQGDIRKIRQNFKSGNPYQTLLAEIKGLK